MKKTIFSVVLFFLFAVCRAQDLHEAPTLQIGLGGIGFSKGSLDAQLVAEIIAEKQKELKTALIKNMLLRTIGVENGLFYTYIDNTIDIIATEKNDDTRTKNLIENTVNLSFVVGYADYYMRTLPKQSPETHRFRLLANAYGIDSNLVGGGKGLADIARIDYGRQNEKQISAPPGVAKQLRNAFVGVVIDLFAEVVRQNDQLKQLGLMRTNFLQTSTSNSYLELDADTLQEIRKELSAYPGLLDDYLWVDQMIRFRPAPGNEKPPGYSKEEKAVSCQGKKFRQNEILVIRGIFGQMKEAVRKQTAVDSCSVLVFQQYLDRISGAFAALDSSLRDNEEILEIYAYCHNENKKVNAQQLLALQLDSLYKTVLGFNPEVVVKDTSIITPNTRNAAAQMVKYAQLFYKMHLLNGYFAKRSLADSVFADARENLDLYLTYFGLIKTIAAKGTNTGTVLTALEKAYPDCGNAGVTLDSLQKTYAQMMDEVMKTGKLLESDYQDIRKINGFFDKMQFVALNRYEYLSQYEKEIRPAIDRLGVYSTRGIQLNKEMYAYIMCIGDAVKKDLDKLHINVGLSFMSLFTRLNEFDRTGTYDQYMNLLSDAGDLFSDESMRHSINQIISFVRSYLKFTKDGSNTVITLDAEGFITSIQKMRYDRFRPLDFHFTVGANSTSFRSLLTVNDSVSLRNYSYIGEKIGVKLKLWDWAYTHSFPRGADFSYYRWGYYHWWQLVPLPIRTEYVRTVPPNEPVVSNVHLLAYGSGILYNLVNTGTTKDFNYPLAGAGLGFTFFNGLDINFTMGKPILPAQRVFSKTVPYYFNLGFDIQFVEYIDRVNRKRKDSQTQKRLAQAKTAKQ